MTTPMPNKDDCKEPGLLVPVIDRNECEAKADCVAVCPYQVFDLLPVAASDRATMSLKGRLKLLAHGGRQAYVMHPEACHACGQCVVACPERAIKLRKAP